MILWDTLHHCALTEKLKLFCQSLCKKSIGWDEWMTHWMKSLQILGKSYNGIISIHLRYHGIISIQLN